MAEAGDVEVERRDPAEAAARQFYRRGFQRVTLADVAAEVGISAPAVYRHFTSKQDLLAAAITTALDAVDSVMGEGAGSFDDVVRDLAGLALRRRDVWVLLQLERRFLQGQPRVDVQARWRTTIRRFAGLIGRERPRCTQSELAVLAAAGMAALASPSTHHLVAPRLAYRLALAETAAAVCRADIGVSRRSRSSQGPPPQRSRRQELVRAAVELFSERGYDAVSLDDIGAAVGIAGPSIFHHFATKSDILATAVADASERLSRLRPGGLEALVGGYVDFALDNSALLGVSISESARLSDAARRKATATLRADIQVWVEALVSKRPDLDRTTALVRVHAARGVINDLVRLRAVHDRPAIADELRHLGRAALTGCSRTARGIEDG